MIKRYKVILFLFSIFINSVYGMKRDRSLWQETTSPDFLFYTPERKRKIAEQFVIKRQLKLIRANISDKNPYFLARVLCRESILGGVPALDFSHDGLLLALTTTMGTLFWSVNKKHFFLEPFTLYSSGIADVHLSMFSSGDQDTFLIQGFSNGALKVFKKNEHKNKSHENNHDNFALLRSFFIPDSVMATGVFSGMNAHECIVGDMHGNIHIIHLDTAAISVVSVGEVPIVSLAAVPGEDAVVVSFVNGLVRVITFERGNGTISIKKNEKIPDSVRFFHEGSSVRAVRDIYNVAVSPFGNYIVAGSSFGCLKIFERETLGLTLKNEFSLRARGAFPAWRTSITSLAFSADEKYLACGDNKGVVYLILLKETDNAPQFIAFEVFNSAPVQSLVFSPQGDWLAIGSSDGHVKLWRSYQSLSQEEIEEGKIPYEPNPDSEDEWDSEGEY